MKKIVTLSTLFIDPDPATFRPRLAIWVTVYAQTIKAIGFALKARVKFGASYSIFIGIVCFFALITASALLPACSPCRIAMWSVDPADLGCTNSGFRISECSVPECPFKTGDLCTRPTTWKATCKKDGREFDCEAYPRKPAHCFP